MKFDPKNISMAARAFLFKEDTVLFIRPLPRIKQSTRMTADGQFILTGETQLERFIYCLEGWKKAKTDANGKVIVDAEGNPEIDEAGIAVADNDGKAIKLTDEIKKAIFDANWEGIADFVLIQSILFNVKKAASEKN